MRADIASAVFALGLLFACGAMLATCRWMVEQPKATLVGRAAARKAKEEALGYTVVALGLCGLAAAIRFWPW